jgi:hypothetical protein
VARFAQQLRQFRNVRRDALGFIAHEQLCSTACPRFWGYSRMPLFMYRCPYSGYRVQGFVAEDTSEDGHIYEPVTCPVCHQIHHVNPHTGVVLGDKADPGSSSK